MRRRSIRELTAIALAALCALFLCCCFGGVGLGESHEDASGRASNSENPEDELAMEIADGDEADGSATDGGTVFGNASDKGLPDGNAADAGQSEEGAEADAPVEYPTGWLAVPVDGVPAGVPVRIRHLPDIDVVAHRDGEPASELDQAQLDEDLPDADVGIAAVEYDGSCFQVDTSALLVNLPDVLPQACYDVVYSYASTSNCAGMDIPGVTGQRLAGYAEGKQANAYLANEEFAVPCAYGTACKLKLVCDSLDRQGYKLLVYDAYRPMSAQWQLSDSFQQACAENPEIANNLGVWAMGWYVANGASGHNFGTDIDVGVCDEDGNPLPMPSSFDAFDESGHLTYAPMDSASITPESYCDAVAENAACLALHQAFCEAGFVELASEWWHFSDPESEYAMRAAAGDGGLDFVAVLE